MSSTTTTTTVLETDQVKTFRDFLTNYNKLSELCFVDCVWDFTTRSVKPQEEKCALNCMEKYLKMNQRISNRFQEYQITTNEHALAESKKSGVDLAITKISQTKKIAVSKMGKISVPSECLSFKFHMPKSKFIDHISFPIYFV